VSTSLPGLKRTAPQSIESAIAKLQRDVAALAGAPTPAGDAISKTAQVANITTTNIVQFAKSGIYEVTAILQCTTADAGAGLLTLTLAWTDRVGATTDVALTRIQTATGRNSRSYEIQVTGDTAITYAVAVTGVYLTAVYALEIRLLKVA
jgi:hypothetical protein